MNIVEKLKTLNHNEIKQLAADCMTLDKEGEISLDSLLNTITLDIFYNGERNIKADEKVLVYVIFEFYRMFALRYFELLESIESIYQKKGH